MCCYSLVVFGQLAGHDASFFAVLSWIRVPVRVHQMCFIPEVEDQKLDENTVCPHRPVCLVVRLGCLRVGS